MAQLGQRHETIGVVTGAFCMSVFNAVISLVSDISMDITIDIK